MQVLFDSFFSVHPERARSQNECVFMAIKISYKKIAQIVAYVAVIAGIGAGGYFSRNVWLPTVLARLGYSTDSDEHDTPVPDANSDGPETLKLSKQARANLNLVSKPVKVQTYWRKLQIPGAIVHRPGLTDRGITSPIAGIVTEVHALEGDLVRPGDKLFTIRLISEYLQKTQSELFTAIRETEILNKEIDRVTKLVRSGIIPEKRVIELKQGVSRQAALIESRRQDLLAHGLNTSHLSQIEAGKFVNSIDVLTPPFPDSPSKPVQNADAGLDLTQQRLGREFFEIQQLNVELGHQVVAGASLAVLANHENLYIQGHAFKKEAANLERAIQNHWDVDVEFTEDSFQSWPELEQSFQIRHISNTVDPRSRTFDFFIPLTNQFRTYEKDDRFSVVWRFRPGQRVRLHVPVEKLENVIVLPASAVFREGPEIYVFQQNGDLFNRLPVHVVYEDRLNVLVANDGSVLPGSYLAQGSAAALNRVYKSQAASGKNPNLHVHADGTVHAAH